MENKLIWQTRDEMPYPTNPMQALREMLTGTPRDISEDKLLSAIYGIIVGWDEASYEKLKISHGWTEHMVNTQKSLHINALRCWNLYMESIKK